MNTRTLIINPEYVRNNSTVSDNMEDAYIIPSIIDAQISGLMPIIGEPLYDAICTMIENDTLKDNAKYKDLVDNYISMYLLYQTIGEMTVDNYQRQHNAGSVNYTDTNYNQIALADLKYMAKHWSDKASFYAERMSDYLHANGTDYPEFHTYEKGKMSHDDLANTYYCGIGLGIKESIKRKDR